MQAGPALRPIAYTDPPISTPHPTPGHQVFNSAGAKEFNAGVPDCWAIINGTDPVAWIPKVRLAPAR